MCNPIFPQCKGESMQVSTVILASVAQLDSRLIGDQEVAGSIPAGSDKIIS